MFIIAIILFLLLLLLAVFAGYISYKQDLLEIENLKNQNEEVKHFKIKNNDDR